MTEPIVNSNDQLRVQMTNPSLEVDPAQNPLVGALLASTISISTTPSNTGAIEFGTPKLSPPSTETFAMKMLLQYSQIITNLLDNWNTQLHQQADVQREDQKQSDITKNEIKHQQQSKDVATENIAKKTGQKIGVLDSSQLVDPHKEKILTGRGREAHDPSLMINAWQSGIASVFALYSQDFQNSMGIDSSKKVDGISASQHVSSVAGANAADLDRFQPSSAMTSALVIATGFLGSFKTSEVSGAVQVDNKVLQDAWSQMAAPHNPNDAATQVAGWVSALWGVGLTYFTAAEEVGKMESGNKNTPKDLEFAVKYAENLIAGLASGQFMAHIRAIVITNTQPGEKLDHQKIERLCNMGKVVLLTVALAQIMKLELSSEFKGKVFQGHISGDDVIAMLRGELDFTKNDPQGLAGIKGKLIAQINNVLDQMPPKEREELMGNMRAYFNTNPSVEKLSDVNRVVGEVFNAENIDENQFKQTPA